MEAIRTHYTHTRTCRPEVVVNSCSAFFPSRDVLPPGPPRRSGELLRHRGPREPSISVRIVLFFLHVFLLGLLAEETPCEHGENMQTPHRKAREIAHLSTVHSLTLYDVLVNSTVHPESFQTLHVLNCLTHLTMDSIQLFNS